MAEAKICICPQCGKKFKVSAEADAASFACSQCGATVWIDGKGTANEKVVRVRGGFADFDEPENAKAVHAAMAASPVSPAAWRPNAPCWSWRE